MENHKTPADLNENAFCARKEHWGLSAPLKIRISRFGIESSNINHDHFPADLGQTLLLERGQSHVGTPLSQKWRLQRHGTTGVVTYYVYQGLLTSSQQLILGKARKTASKERECSMNWLRKHDRRESRREYT